MVYDANFPEVFGRPAECLLALCWIFDVHRSQKQPDAGTIPE
jgi:hypothetical protein